MEKRQQKGFVIFLTFVPVLSLLSQLLFSYLDGNLELILKHYTVMYVDFTFVPLNFFICKSIDWQKGKRIMLIFLVAITLSSVVHYGWSINGTDPGHMIKASGFINPAGWVHIIFSAVEFCLMLLFILDYQAPTKRVLLLSTLFLHLYFISSLIGGYFIHGAFIVEDIVRVSVACVVFAIYYFIRRKGVNSDY